MSFSSLTTTHLLFVLFFPPVGTFHRHTGTEQPPVEFKAQKASVQAECRQKVFAPHQANFKETTKRRFEKPQLQFISTSDVSFLAGQFA